MAVKTKTRASATPKKSRGTPRKPRSKKQDLSEESDVAAGDDSGDAYEEADDDDESEPESLDSDKLDDEPSKKKRKASSSPKKKASPRKKRREADEDGEGYDVELGDQQEVVGRLVEAPKTGRVPAGQISQNTLNFLKLLMNPDNNDREWFKLHEPVYRLAEKEWVDFVEKFTDKVAEIDDEIPPLPPKDVIHRIYRDIRFSNDKTPYKTNFSASFSRSGRKGIFAHYHISISPGGRSIIAGGVWAPGKNELATIRSHILRDPSRLRNIIENKEFVRMFGPAKPHPKGEIQSLWGHDALKVAPKGIDKNHRDIDLLKLRSMVVIHHFLDSEVTDPNFMETLESVVTLMRPLVHVLNDMITIPPDEDEEDAEEQEE